MLKLMKIVGLAFVLGVVMVAFSGVKVIENPCNLTAALGGIPICDNNVQWNN